MNEILNFKMVPQAVQIPVPEDIYQKYESVMFVTQAYSIQHMQYNGRALVFTIGGTDELQRENLNRSITNLNLEGVEFGFIMGCNTPIITIYGDKTWKNIQNLLAEYFISLTTLNLLLSFLFLNKKSFRLYFFRYIDQALDAYLEILDIISNPIRKCLEYIFSDNLASYIAVFFMLPFIAPAIPFILLVIVTERFVDNEKIDDFFKSQERAQKLRYEYDVQVSKVRKKYFSTTFDGDKNE